MDTQVLTTYIIPVGSLVVALAAVFVGPWVSMRIARKQTVLPLRREWIEDLRRETAGLISEANYFISMRMIEGSDIRDVLECQKRSNLSVAKIRLMVNPDVDSHAKLIKSVLCLSDLLRPERAVNLEEFATAVLNAENAAREVFIQEWAKVKNWRN